MEIRKKKEDKKEWSYLSLKDRLTLIISSLGLVIQIFGFYYVVQGLKSSEKALNSNERAVSTNTYLQTYGWTLEMDKTLVENPKLMPYFSNGLSQMPSCVDDSIKVEAMAEYMLDNFDAVLNNKSYFEIDPTAGKGWKETVRSYFLKDSILRKRFSRERKLYGDTLNSVYESALRQLHY